MLNMLTTPDTLSTDAVYSHIISSLATDLLDVSTALLYEVDIHVQPGRQFYGYMVSLVYLKGINY
jgi:hypothetical protein